MRRYNQLAGQVFGNLTVLRRAPRQKGNARWLCRCTCGKEKEVRSDQLLLGRQKSCALDGHYWNVTPSSVRRKEHPFELQSWLNMQRRCFEKTNHKYRAYGGRGITVCDRWLDFDKFLDDMGPKPAANYTIERKDVRGNYEPGNCRWATKAEQYRNLRRSTYVEVNGERRLLMDVADSAGLNRQVVYGRLRMGWSLEDALTTPVRPKKKNRKRRRKNVVDKTTNPA